MKKNDSIDCMSTGVLPAVFSQRTKKAMNFNYTFVCADKETAKPDRSIPLTELYRKFINGESISDVRMMNLGYNPLETNPFKRKGLDRADLPEIARENKAIIERAGKMLSDELQSKNASQNEPKNEPQNE